jgi:predicted Zn-dependent protease
MSCSKKSIIVCALLSLFSFVAFAGDYDKGWDALNRNDKPHAIEYFRKALKSDPARKSNAMAALILLEAYEMNSAGFLDRYPNPLDVFTDINPYVYALWFNDAVLGDYGVKTGKQLANLERVLNEPRFHGSLKAAANYFKGFHYFSGQMMDSAALAFPKIGALESWQFVGAFDNISGSGFNKEYGPVKDPSAGKGFTSYNNTTIDWFKPLLITQQGWVFVGSLFPANTAVGYAQTFVNADADKDAILCLGGRGSLKVWVNDKLLIAEEEERATELDQYNVRCHLNKGYNRILVQIGFTNDEIPNFIVRLADEKYETLKGINITSDVQSYQPNKATDAPKLLPHFAEAYFKEQIAKYPQDPMYPILLSKVYTRNKERDKAKAAMYGLYKKYPDNALVLYQYMDCMSYQYDRTALAELTEKIKQMDPENYQVMQNNEDQLEKEKKYSEALDMINQMDAKNGPRVWSVAKRLYLNAYLQRVDSMVYLLKEAYAKYPENPQFAAAMSQYHEQMLKDPVEGLKVLEKYLTKYYEYDMMKALAEAYFQQNEPVKGVATLKRIIASAPYDINTYTPLVSHFFARQEYDSAIHYLEIEHKISPYQHQPLGDIASCYLQMGDKKKALEYYKRALQLYAGGYTYREKIRELESKPDVFSYFPQQDYYAEINKNLKARKDTSKSYYYIFNEKKVVLYAEGASEQVNNIAVYINNKDGLERWKEVSIPYNSIYQDMTIVKAEVIKASGAKVPAETYDNEVVYTRLEPGDVVYLNYKVSNYGIGRLGREYWDKFYFSTFSPTLMARYSILVADQLPMYYELTNSQGVKPVESKHENFRLYTWEMRNVPAFKDEGYSPNVNDIGQVLHVSTVKSWDFIAEWYSDITRIQSKEDFDVNAAYKEVFPNGVAGLNDNEKAQHIYNYIEQHISYSSVSFRQGAYVPQRASKTLNTRLGDCKDLSTLFVSFARKAGMEANLVLVSTRGNGQQGMRLPSMEFNHCIVQYKDGNDYRSLELTDNHLPFNAMPQSLVGAQMLNIPYEYKSGEAIRLFEPQGHFDVTKSRKSRIVVDNTDLHINTILTANGEVASGLRSSYSDKAQDELKQDLQESVSGQFRNPVTLEKFSFSNLDNLKDTVIMDATYTVKNDVISVGDLNMVKPPLLDIVATADIFNNEPRQYPFEYWRYENVDHYNTEVEIELPAGKAFDQVPGNVQASFGDMKYELTYVKTAPNKLLIKRIFQTNIRDNIQPDAFPKMKDFFNLIVAAEQKYVSFK